MNNGMQILQLLSAIKNPDTMYQNMMQNNPQFKQFVEATKGMNAEDIANKYGIDFSAIKSLLK